MSDLQKKDRPFLGHAIANGKLRFTSASQITTFSPESEGCNRRFAYQYVFGIKLAKTPAQLAGTTYARDLETWLKRGEMVLPSTLLEGKKFFPSPWNSKGELDLECEKPLGDMARAVALRDALLRGEIQGSVDAHLEAIRRAAGVAAAGVPLEGAADYRHRRQEYIDGDGFLRQEAAGTYVVEIGDLKSISRIGDRKVMKGKRRGEIDRGYAKTAAEVCKTPQMLAYGVHAVDAYEGVTHVRLSHVYCSTQRKEASKRTGLLSIEEVRRRWAERVEPMVRKMIEVAGAQKIEDVEPNALSCGSYTHLSPEDGKTVLKGCGYRYQCPLSHVQIAQVITKEMIGDASMSTARSLFDQLAPDAVQPSVPPAPPAPPAPPISTAEREAQIAAERAKLLAAEQGMLGGDDEEDDEDVEAAVPPSPPLPPSPPSPPGVFLAVPPGAVLPPDAPRHVSMLDAAAPLPASEVARMQADPTTDPEIMAAVLEHNRLHTERAAREAQAAPKKAGGRCPGTGQTVAISVAEAMRKKVICPIVGCGVEKPIPKEVREAGATSMAFPGHNVPKAAEVAAPSPPTANGLANGVASPVMVVALTAGDVDVLASLFRDRARALLGVVSAEAEALLRRLRMVD